MLTYNSKNQKQLYEYNEEFKYFTEMLTKKKLPNKILIKGRKGIGKCTFAYHLINYIFSLNEEHPYDNKKFKINEKNKSFILINESVHPNTFIVNLEDKKKTIDIDKAREIIKFNNKSSMINNSKIILINDAEFLNINSSNALLKIIEEPNDDTIIILIQDSSKRMLDTLSSRFVTFNFNLKFNQTLNILNNLLEDDVKKYFNDEYLNYSLTPGFLINLYNFSIAEKKDLKKDTFKDLISYIIEKSLFKKNNFLIKNFNTLIEIYFNMMIKINDDKEYIYNCYNEVTNKIDAANKYNLDKENVYNEFKSKFLNA